MLQIIGVASDLDQIAGLLDVRKRQLGLTNMALDDAAGLSHGYASKLFAKGYNKHLGNMSLSSLLGAMGGAIFLVCDDDLVPDITRRFMGMTDGGGSWSRPPALMPPPNCVAVPIRGLPAPREEAPPVIELATWTRSEG